MISLASRRGGAIAWIGDFAVVSAAATFLMLPWLLGYPAYGHSYWYNVSYITEFANQMGQGDLYPRWVSGLWDGAGGSDFFFYAPLPFSATGLLQLGVCPSCDGNQLLVISGTIWLAISGLGFRLFAREFVGRWAAVTGALVYMALPYHLGVDWHDRQAIGEFAAAALIPWHIWSYRRCLRGEQSGPLLAVLTALMLLSHLPSSIVLAVASLALFPAMDRAPGWQPVGRVACAAVVGTGLAAVYWVPAILELPNVLSGLNVTGQYAAVNWLMVPLSFTSEFSFARLLWTVFLLLSVLAIVALLLNRGKVRGAPIAFVLLAVVWFLVTPLSLPVWLWTPLVQIQFPYRFLTVSDIAFAFAAAVCVHGLSSWPARGWRSVGSGLVLAGIVAISAAEHPGLRDSRSAQTPPELPITIGQFVWHSVEIASDFERATHAEESALIRDLHSVPGPVVTPVGRGELLSLDPRRRTYQIDLPAPARVVIRSTYWPYWRLSDAATGEEIPISPRKGFPLIEADLPAGRRIYVLEMPVLRTERAGLAISLAFLLVLAGWSVAAWRHSASDRIMG